MIKTRRGRSGPVILAAVTALVPGAAVVFSGALTALLALSLFSAGVLTLLVRRLNNELDEHEMRRLTTWTIALYVGHLVVGLIITNTNLVWVFGGDAIGYHLAAVEMVQHWTSGLPAPPTSAPGKEGFVNLLAATYWVFGNHTAAGLAVNAALATALVPILSALTHRLFGKDPARYVPWVLLLPGLFLWSSQLLREAAIVLLIALAMTFAVRLTERTSIPALVGLAVSLAFLLTFRGYLAVAIAGALGIGIAIGHRGFVAGFSTTLGGIVAMSILVLSVGVGYSGFRSTTDSDLQRANQVRQGFATTASGFDAQADISSTSRALSYLPRGLVNFSLGPFPWQITNARQLPGLIDAAMWWFLVPLLWAGLRESIRRLGRRVLVLLVPAGVTSAVVTLIIGNFGTLVRSRAQVIVILAPIIALGISQSRTRRPRPIGLSTATGAAAGLVSPR